MHINADHSALRGLACEVCGRLPHPRRLRLTTAKLAAVFPVELVLHAIVMHYHLSYVATVTFLTVATTVLVIWVVEPSAGRLLRTWLHAPELAARERLGAAEQLWRVRLTVEDEPGALEAVTHNLARLDVNILSLHVHPLERGVRDELVVAAPELLPAEELVRAVEAAGGRTAHAWRTTALALVDGPTRVLDLAAKVSHDPSELPHSVAELLGAGVVNARMHSARGPHGAGETTLRVPTPWAGPIVLTRPDEPFTPAESARAHRLAEIAEIAAITQAGTPS